MQKFLIILGIITGIMLIAAVKSHNAVVFVIFASLVLVWVLSWKWWRGRNERLYKKIAYSLNFKPIQFINNTASYELGGKVFNLVFRKNRIIMLTEATLRKGSEKQNFTETNQEMKALETILSPLYQGVSTTGEISSNGQRAAFAVNIPINDENINGLDDILNRFSQIIEAYT